MIFEFSDWWFLIIIIFCKAQINSGAREAAKWRAPKSNWVVTYTIWFSYSRKICYILSVWGWIRCFINKHNSYFCIHIDYNNKNKIVNKCHQRYSKDQQKIKPSQNQLPTITTRDYRWPKNVHVDQHRGHKSEIRSIEFSCHGESAYPHLNPRRRCCWSFQRWAL